MTDDDRALIDTFSTACANVCDAAIQGGVNPEAALSAVATALRKVMERHGEPSQASAALRLEANRLDAMQVQREAPALQEMIALNRQAHDFISTLQLSGVDEKLAITSLHNACIERVVRSINVEAATRWLRRMADQVERDFANYVELSKTH